MVLAYFVIDTETTGFSTEKHEIIEYSIIRCSDRTQITRTIKAEHPNTADPKSLEIINKTYKDLLKESLKSKGG